MVDQMVKFRTAHELAYRCDKRCTERCNTATAPLFFAPGASQSRAAPFAPVRASVSHRAGRDASAVGVMARVDHVSPGRAVGRRIGCRSFFTKWSGFGLSAKQQQGWIAVTCHFWTNFRASS
jgi:hypothetical protein